MAKGRLQFEQEPSQVERNQSKLIPGGDPSSAWVLFIYVFIERKNHKNFIDNSNYYPYN